jgi:hypothetical protein
MGNLFMRIWGNLVARTEGPMHFTPPSVLLWFTFSQSKFAGGINDTNGFKNGHTQYDCPGNVL